MLFRVAWIKQRCLGSLSRLCWRRKSVSVCACVPTQLSDIEEHTVNTIQHRAMYRSVIKETYKTFGCYGVATGSRLLKIIGLFCRILSLL